MIDRTAGGLDQEQVGAAAVFLVLQVHFAVGECLQHQVAELQAQRCADLLGQARIGGSGEDFQTIGRHRPDRLNGGHSFSSMCGRSVRHQRLRERARLTSENGKTFSSKNDLAAHFPCPRVQNNPKSAEPLPVSIAGFAPSLTSRCFKAASCGNCSKTTVSKSLMQAPAPSSPQACDWKLTILFCCDSVVNRGVRAR